MKLAWDLEVDVNGEEVFYVTKEILCSFSGRLSKLLSNASVTSATKPLKVIFHDLPGGAEAFELFTKFCYNNGRIQMTPTNTCILFFIAKSMEVTEEVDSSCSLVKQVEKSVDGIYYWSWTEVLTALKQCQNSSQLLDSSVILEKVLDSLVARIAAKSDTSPSSSSPESSIFRVSFDTKSNMSTKNSHHRTWWFEDLIFLNSKLIEKVVKRMISSKLEHAKISKFLFYYLKFKCSYTAYDEKRRVIETVIDLLYSLNRNSVSCKGLFYILRVSSSQNVSSCCRDRLENMIGSQIDQASLDNLLISSPAKTDSLYDVNILLRFLRHFLTCGGRTSLARLKKVADLLDLYMAEVAPDIFLKHSKFVELVTALPDSARDSHDSLYRSIDMYLEAHNRLTEVEKMKICCAINYEKLCSESCQHLAQNSKFPSRTAAQALLSQQSKLKGLLQESNHFKSFNGEGRRSIEADQIVLYAKKLDPMMENEKLKAHLQGMHADFGLASFFDPYRKQPMTSRVVTLWYRPPELLLGATNYGVGVDLWSAGCILAELLAGKPIMPGRTEVEQLHKIFKLCGSPSEDYWKKSKLPHATIFKPQHPYKRCIKENFKDFPLSSFSVIETLLAIEPAERQTASAALESEFFTTPPFACEPSSLPQYPPSKEMDAKLRDEEARRLKAGGGKANGDGTRKHHNRDRPSRAVPAPEANAEVQANLDRRRLISHANAKSKSEKFPPPHQDGALGYPAGSPNHIDTTFDPPDVPYSSVFPYQKGQPASTWSGPLVKSALDNPRRKKQTAIRLSSKNLTGSKEVQKVKNNSKSHVG